MKLEVVDVLIISAMIYLPFSPILSCFLVYPGGEEVGEEQERGAYYLNA